MSEKIEEKVASSKDNKDEKAKPKDEADEKEKEAQTWAGRWRKTRTAFGNIPGAFRMVWAAHPSATTAMAIMTLVNALLPAGQAWAGKLIVDSVVNAINSKQPVEVALQAAAPFLLLEFLFISTSMITGQLDSLLEHIIQSRLGHYIQMTIIRKALTLDLHYFEDAAFYDKLQNARREINWRPMSIVNNSFLVVQNIITLLSVIIILFAFNPLVALILFGTTIPAFLSQLHYSKLYFRLLTWHSPEFRRKAYWEHLLTVDSSMKEIKLFGLGEPLLKRYDAQFWEFYKEDAALARRRILISTAWGLLGTVSYYGAYAWAVFRTLQGAITLGDMTLYLALFRQSQGSFRGIFYSAGQLYEGSLFMTNLYEFLKLKPETKEPEHVQPVPDSIKHGIEFRNVSFRYPDRDNWAVRGVNLSIGAGEKIALVGANGAGKTTLVKLLTRLYEPTEGQILLDGVDLRDYQLDKLRQRIGVIFQDFVRYQVTARENIGFGQINALDDEARIALAAKRGGADSVIEELDEGYESILGRWFDKGHELSGGQWQKIALSRAFMRDGDVLVLDEPTAALDAEREYEIFQRFRELTQGKIAFLISHRFSTVRMADRIAVLEGGQITELGSHQELLAQNGTYARLFNLQAEGYR